MASSAEIYSETELNKLSYRQLQQKSKALLLPSNYKKIYLIKLILAKKFGTEAEVESIIDKVKRERHAISQVRKTKERLFSRRGSLSSNISYMSPSISITPNQTGPVIIQYCAQPTSRFSSKRNSANFSPRSHPYSGDRVLRNRNPTPNKVAHLMASNKIFNAMRSRNNSVSSRTATPRDSCDRFNNRTTRNSMESPYNSNATPRIIPPSVYEQNESRKQPAAAKRGRLVSGIYPLNDDTNKPNKDTYRLVQGGFTIKNPNGSYTRINTLVRKARKDSTASSGTSAVIDANLQSDNQGYSSVEFTLNELFNGTIESTSCNIIEGTQCNINESNDNLCPLLTTTFDHLNLTNDVSMFLTTTNEPVPSEAIDGNGELGYLHKKTRSESVRSRRESTSSEKREASAQEKHDSNQLPKVHEVFNNFADLQSIDYTHPLYVQVSDDAARAIPAARPPAPAVGGALEPLYNYRRSYCAPPRAPPRAPPPAARAAPPPAPRAVYATPTICTSQLHEARAPHTSAYYDVHRYLQTNVHYLYTHPLYNSLSAEQAVDVPLTTSTYYADSLITMAAAEASGAGGAGDDGSSGASLGANVTIPEMVEDALEVISQDGDYMERMGMDLHIQCVLCAWSGAKFILDHHIRKEHSDKIHKLDTFECDIRFTLGALCAERAMGEGRATGEGEAGRAVGEGDAGRAMGEGEAGRALGAGPGRWASQVLEDSAGSLYVLSARYDDPDHFTATISSLLPDEPCKTGTITVYNKITGQPHVWQGEIPSLPLGEAPDDCHNCLKLNLSDLDLLPNSANLKLLNRELVSQSPSKVVCGQPSLDDIHIILFVKI